MALSHGSFYDQIISLLYRLRPEQIRVMKHTLDFFFTTCLHPSYFDAHFCIINPTDAHSQYPDVPYLCSHLYLITSKYYT